MIGLIGFLMTLVWVGFFFWMEGKKRTYVIYVGVIIDIILFAISRNIFFLLAGVLTGIVLGLAKAGGNKILAKLVRGDAIYKMQGWKNWVVFSVIVIVMLYMSLAIMISLQ